MTTQTVTTRTSIITIPAVALHDNVFYTRRGVPVKVDSLELTPVHVIGNCMLSHFSGWPGVGYSTHPYAMKAFRDQDGNIYRPSRSHNDERGSTRQLTIVQVEPCYIKSL